MEQTNLNQKSWYRGLKVFFVLAFLLAQGFGFLITYSVTSEKVSFVKCDNGKELEPATLSFDQDKMKLDLFKQCDITAFLLQKSGVKGILTDAQMKELGVQISQMQNSGSLQVEMQSAVDTFKQNYADRTPNTNLPKSYTAEEFAKLYGHDPKDTFTVTGNDLPSSGLSFQDKISSNWVANFTFQDKEKYSPIVKAIYYVLSFLIVGAMFWLISRIFFYIFAKEPFLKLPNRGIKK